MRDFSNNFSSVSGAWFAFLALKGIYSTIRKFFNEGRINKR
jgi:hypothetical protein